MVEFVERSWKNGSRAVPNTPYSLLWRMLYSSMKLLRSDGHQEAHQNGEWFWASSSAVCRRLIRNMLEKTIKSHVASFS
jgi:hypothetical protein